MRIRVTVGQNEAVVIERLGRLNRVLMTEGKYWLLPLLELPHRLRYSQTRLAADGNTHERHHFESICISLLQQSLSLPPMLASTLDEGEVTLSPALTYTITDPSKVCYAIHDYTYGLEQILMQSIKKIIARLPYVEVENSPQRTQAAALAKIKPQALVWGIEVHQVQW